jgi:hypothetical protein
MIQLIDNKAVIFRVIIILLTVNITFGQNKWYLPNKEEWISYGLTSLSGISFGFNQAIDHHHYGQGKKFIDIDISWKNKYKNWDAGDKREKYFGSKTFLVWTTDAYHLTSVLEKSFLGAGATVNTLNLKRDLELYRKKDRWKVIVFKKVLLPIVFRSLAFELTYNKLK